MKEFQERLRTVRNKFDLLRIFLDNPDISDDTLKQLLSGNDAIDDVTVASSPPDTVMPQLPFDVSKRENPEQTSEGAVGVIHSSSMSSSDVFVPKSVARGRERADSTSDEDRKHLAPTISKPHVRIDVARRGKSEWTSSFQNDVKKQRPYKPASLEQPSVGLASTSKDATSKAVDKASSVRTDESSSRVVVPGMPGWKPEVTSSAKGVLESGSWVGPPSPPLSLDIIEPTPVEPSIQNHVAGSDRAVSTNGADVKVTAESLNTKDQPPLKQKMGSRKHPSKDKKNGSDKKQKVVIAEKQAREFESGLNPFGKEMVTNSVHHDRQNHVELVTHGSVLPAPPLPPPNNKDGSGVSKTVHANTNKTQTSSEEASSVKDKLQISPRPKDFDFKAKGNDNVKEDTPFHRNQKPQKHLTQDVSGSFVRKDEKFSQVVKETREPSVQSRRAEKPSKHSEDASNMRKREEEVYDDDVYVDDDVDVQDYIDGEVGYVSDKKSEDNILEGE
jgi:hypothetical protein